MSTKSTDLSPQKRTRVNTRVRLLAAARQEFIEIGFAGSSVEQICARAGFTRGAFYSNYATKDELFLAVWDDQVRSIAANVAAAASTIECAEEPLAAAIAAFGDLHMWDRDWFILNTEFLLHALREPAAAARLTTHRAALRTSLGRILDSIRDSVQVDLPPRIDRETFTRLTIALFVGEQHQSLVEPELIEGGNLQAAATELLVAACTPKRQ